MLIGLIADTHGYVGGDVLAAFAGCGHIIHAGDIGEGVLDALSAIAPVTAVRGNNDITGAPALLPEMVTLDIEGHRVAVVHRLADKPAGEWDLLLFGHCHRQHDYEEGGRRHINPGAAGLRGFHRERSVALLELRAGEPPQCQFADLGPRPAARAHRIPSIAGGQRL